MNKSDTDFNEEEIIQIQNQFDKTIIDKDLKKKEEEEKSTKVIHACIIMLYTIHSFFLRPARP